MRERGSERDSERETWMVGGGMPGTAFDGSMWVTGAQVGALALGSVASVAVSAALVRKAALEDARMDTRKKRNLATPKKRERVQLNRAKRDTKLEWEANEPTKETKEDVEQNQRDAWNE